jgi:competence protein ComEC
VVPGGFDSQFHAYFDGVGAWGSVLGEMMHLEGSAGSTLDRFVSDLRQEIGRRIDSALDQPASGIARALTIGDQSRVEEGTRTNMQAAGLAHVLAISGLHLTLVAGGVFAALRIGLALSYSLSQRIPVKKIAAVGGTIAALIYLVLSGASVSATRATIMLVLIFGAVIAGRRALTMRNVAIAAILVIAIDPASVFRASFQLSFAAVVALIGTYELLRGRQISADDEITALRRLGRWIGGMAVTSLVAGGATALFAAYHFQQVAPLGVIGNILALPVVGFVVLPAALLGVLAMPFGFEAPFLTAMGFGLDAIFSIARLVAGWSAGIDGSPLIAPMGLIIACAALGWFAFFPKRWRLAGPLAALPLIVMIGLDRAPDVMIADTTQAVAVRDSNELGLIAGRRNSFAVSVWTEQVQEEIASDQPGRICDNTACVLTSDLGFTVSLVDDASAFAEDCRWADLVVARLSAPAACRQMTQVVDASDLATGGVHWLAWNAERQIFDIQPAITDPDRPWRPQP